MQKRLNSFRENGGIEVAINPNDLRVAGNARILEGQSTAGFREEPYIQPPNRQGSTNRVIQSDQLWAVEVNWQVDGLFACLLDCGYWKCKLYFEQMGGRETSFSPEAITQDLGRPGQRYRGQIDVQPYALKPGVYQVIVCLQYCFENGNPGPIVGFEDVGLVKIYEEKRVANAQPIENGFDRAATGVSS